MIQPYTITQYPTPIFNTFDLAKCFGGKSGDELPFRRPWPYREVETILFPGTKIELIEKIADSHVWKVRTEEYPSSYPIFIDERFLKRDGQLLQERIIDLPSASVVLETMVNLEKIPYVWGGSWPKG